MANEKGVWRTIGGRRVFIKEGQDLASAMKESGKFKSASKGGAKKESAQSVTDEELKAKYDELRKDRKGLVYNLEEGYLKDLSNEEKLAKLNKELDDINNQKENIKKIDKEAMDYQREKHGEKGVEEYKKYMDQGDDTLKKATGEKKLEAYRVNEDGKKEMYERTLGDDERGYWTKENGRRVFKENPNYKGEQSSADSKTSSKGFYQKEHKLDNSTARDILNQLNSEGSDFTFGEMKIEDGKVKTDVSVFMPDDRGYTTRDLEIPISENETRESFEEKLRDWQYRHRSVEEWESEDFPKSDLDKVKSERMKGAKTSNDIMNEKIRSRGKSKVEEDDLPKHTEIKTQGTSNRKEVSDNIQAHILDYYTKDYTGEDISPAEAFVRQMDAMGEPNKWRAGQKIAEGGSYLIYNGDMADFLDELKINPKGKTFSEDKAFDMYTSLIGRESAKLYDRIQKNSYKKYMKAHPLSKMSFEEFKDMNKK